MKANDKCVPPGSVFNIMIFTILIRNNIALQRTKITYIYFDVKMSPEFWINKTLRGTLPNHLID